jgi:hypothetical protein
MDTGSFMEESGRDVPLTTHTHLAPRLKKEYSYTSTPPLCLHGRLWDELDAYGTLSTLSFSKHADLEMQRGMETRGAFS